jgi:hypothetical protein
MVTSFPTGPVLVGYETSDQHETRRLANSNRVRRHFPHNFRSSYEYLIYYLSEDSHAHKMVIEVPKILLGFGYHILSTQSNFF